jgi:diacylglycerol kinase (ATP)
MLERPRVIVNPASAGGRTGRLWPRLSRRLRNTLGPHEVAFTDQRGAASTLARTAVSEGCDAIIAVGGDGTLSEVVDGLFDDGVAIAPHVAVGHITNGTGGDFRRTFDLAKAAAALAVLARGKTRRIDLGHLRYTTHDGDEATRMFANIASFGLSGWVDRRVNRAGLSKRLGAMAFYYHSLVALTSYRKPVVDITIDDETTISGATTIGCICNGRYAGGGMCFAPQAQPDDGELDVVVIGDANRVELARAFPALYRGTHLDHDHVRSARGRRIVATPASEATVLLDVDGEAPGRLPATFTVVPAALDFIC